MTFSVSKLVVATSVAAGVLFSVSGSAQAQTVGFQFETEYLENNAPEGDIFLDSVKIGDQIIKDFSYISDVTIVENDPFLGGNTGAASADIGDEASTGVAVEAATEGDLLTNLGSKNLNNIVDTEDSGSFVIDLNFEKAIDNLLIWERGKNSDLGVQAFDANGDLIGERLVITRNMWFDTGFSIDTTEIGKAQSVGSLGINIASDLGVDGASVQGVRFFSESEFNGPDWKFVGTDADAAAKVPEPGFILGFGILGSVLALRQRSRTV